MIDEISEFLEWGGGSLGGDHQAGFCGCGGRGFDTRGCFLLRLPRSPFRGCCGFELRFFRPGRLSGGGHYRLLGRLRDRLRRGITMWVGGWSRGSLDDTPPSADVIPPLVQGHLLGRGTGPLGFRSGRFCLWRRSVGCVRALALQEPPSLPSTSHSHGSSLCGFPLSHSTEAAPVG